MAAPGSKKNRANSNKGASLFNLFKPKTDEVEYVTVKEEMKHLHRVLKHRPKSVKHASETMSGPAITERDIEITEKVIDGIAPSDQEGPRTEPDGFNCLQCGAPLSLGADRCPKCNSRYLEISDEALKELESAEMDIGDESEDGEVVEKEGAPCIHFNLETGTVSYLENDNRNPDFMLECSHCGTEIQFDTDRCPICGTALESSDTGLVSLFTDMKFDEVKEDEMDCPLCGEHVTLTKGKCPACSEIVQGGDPRDPSAKVDPVIHNDNVVFMHLDVETGELNYLQRLAKTLGFEQLTVQLDCINKPGFEQDWKSLSRI
ncbi:MAG: zinc ribbon domain-containing protein [Candidatus Thermoplasmatota archaeon]|nr:zinc ribbon domain-containing protein [Candidatus Thermoplasmatota archaeon]MBU1914878.1 zinc ribbon domain-containing protein [Candidatus Thermoplasmatota archaeon]